MFGVKNKQKSDELVNLLIVITIIFSFFLGLTNQFSTRLGSDVYPLVKAVNDYTTGVDPYRHMDQSMFVYHPFVLKILVGINSYIPLRIGLFFLYVLSIVWFGYQSCRWLMAQMTPNIPKIIDIASILLISLSFGGVTIASLLSGNLSAYFHIVLIGLILQYSTHKNILTLFVLGITIILFSIVKPYLLAYVLFYFLVFKKIPAVLVVGIISICAGLIWVSGIYYQPDMYEKFSSALQYQILTKDDLGGFSSLRIIGPILGIKVAFILHLCVVSLVLYALIVIGPRKIEFMQKPANQLLIMLLLIVFINPRMVFYDFYVTVFLLSYLVYINFPNKFNRIILFGFMLALVSQLVVHPTRWVIFAYGCVVMTILMVIVMSSGPTDSSEHSLKLRK